jgi:hypothetical protein
VYARVNYIWMLIIQFLNKCDFVATSCGVLCWDFLYYVFDLYLGSIFFASQLVIPTVPTEACQFFTFPPVRVF